MEKRAIWSRYSKIHNYPGLKDNIRTDVAIIGGGITGISTGLLLAQHGVDTVILESRKVGGGATAHSTGNLYYTIDKILSSLESKYDIDMVKKVAASRMEAMGQIKAWVDQFNLECDYIKVPWFLYSDYQKGCEKIDEEYQAGEKAELPFLQAEKIEIPFPHKKAIKLQHQYQFNPMQYVQELSKAAADTGCQIFENSPVYSVEKENSHYVLHTEEHTVRADKVVHATHSPKGVRMVQSLLGPYREYGIACELEKKVLPDGIYWGYHENEKKVSTRSYTKNGENYLIVVGEPHKTGQAGNNKQHIQNLIKFARVHFAVDDVAYTWGGQHYRPADLLPYIGPEKKNSQEYIATGFSTDGLVYGTLAGMIISDQITARNNPWAELYSANRHQPAKAAGKFLKENLNVAGQVIKDYAGLVIKSSNLDESGLKTGEGRIVKYEGKKLAVFKSEDNKLEAVSPICPHLKCIVHWNNAEKSWDCPCHGSRFKTDGSVLEGPAYHPLKKVEIKQQP